MYEDDETSSWRDDLRVEAVHEFLSRIVSAAELEELDLPHIVVCRDAGTGAVSYSGPFRDGLDAMVFAERESVVDAELNDGDCLSFSVAALYPATRNAG
ncbi:MAG: hypothetical protein ACJ72E_01960 [Marmoricola sp.]